MGSTRQPAKAPAEAPRKARLALAARRRSVAKRKPKIATREKKNENKNRRLIDGCDESLSSRQKSAGPTRSQSATEATKIIVVKNAGIRAAANSSRDCTTGAQRSSRRRPMTTVMPTNAEAKTATNAGVPRCWRVYKYFKILSSRVSPRSTLQGGRAQSHPHP